MHAAVRITVGVRVAVREASRVAIRPASRLLAQAMNQHPEPLLTEI